MTWRKNKRISKEDKAEMYKLYSLGWTIPKIAKITNIPYATVYGYTRLKERGYDSIKAYRDHMAQQRGHNSQSEYLQHRARENAKENGHEARTAYRRNLVVIISKDMV